MNVDFLNDSDMRMYVRTFTGDLVNIHFFWNYADSRLIRLTGDLIPADIEDPVDFLKNSGLVEPSAQAAFDLFCVRIMDILNGSSDDRYLYSDVPLDLDNSGKYTLCHFSIIFGCDENGRAVSANMNIIPYSDRELFDREILNKFTSDKAPQLFHQHILHLMERCPDKEIAYIQFDVERFKLINDVHGVEMGDEILKYFNDSLTVICSDKFPFVRLTSDVFMVVFPFDEEHEITDFIHLIEEKLGGNYKGIEFRLIFGVSIVRDRSLHTRTHGDNATIARKSVKGNAINNIAFFNGSLKTELYKQSNIEEDMIRAMKNGEFVMFLQPKYSISTGRIIGAEALARWLHPEKGLVPPCDFIPIFEKNGFIVKLDQIIWDKACRKLRSWIDKGIDPVPISVNISREYLKSFDVVGKFSQLIKEYNIPKNLLEAEITESVESTDIADIVVRMKENGFTMLMDDFGSGYSSLNVLKRTPFDVLKIDRSFLSEFMESDRGRKIISHTISMSRDIGLDIIAEGVETSEQAEFLFSCGCDTAQGFYYSKPVNEDEFDDILMKCNMMKGKI